MSSAPSWVMVICLLPPDHVIVKVAERASVLSFSLTESLTVSDDLLYVSHVSEAARV